jgi:twitching motility protein PilT
VEFAVFLRQCLQVDAEYPLEKHLLNKKELSQADNEEIDRKHDFAFYATLDNIQYRVRGHLGQDYTGPFLDVRILRSKVEMPDALGFPRELSDAILDRNSGLILVDGRTGSGKSTTLAALASAFSQRYPGSKIATLEDPVEYILAFPNAVVSQKHVGVHVATWADGVFHAKREQPDLLIVGEMRDHETIRATLDAASSGMLVITTAHADRYDRALDALLEAYPPEKHEMLGRRLSYILRGVIVQQLIPSVEAGGEGADFALPSLGFDIFLNNTQAIQSAIRSRQWDRLVNDQQNSYYPLSRRVKELASDKVISPKEAERALTQYDL